MMTATITFNQLEGRSHSVMAEASQTIVRVRQQSSLAVTHWRVLRSLKWMNSNLQKLLFQFYAADTILTLEAASTEQIHGLAVTVGELNLKMREVLTSIHSLDGKIGYWSTLYRPHVRGLEKQTLEVAALADRLAATDAPLVLLTKDAQDHLVKTLLDPPEPNAALRRAFARK